MTRRIFDCHWTLIGLLAIAAAGVSGAGCDDEDDICAWAVGDEPSAGLAAPQEKRNPDTGLCESLYTPPPPGGCCDSQGCYDYDVSAPEPFPTPDWADCYAGCEGLDETTCKATPSCRAAYVGDTFFECWGTSPGAVEPAPSCTGLDAYTCSLYDSCVAIHDAGNSVGFFSRCEPETDSLDPGSCAGNPVCDELAPECPEGTVPGIRDGCWSGFCIPLAQCDEPPTCPGSSESVCVARGCSPIYEGQNCTCDATSCTCEDWLFERCED